MTIYVYLIIIFWSIFLLIWLVSSFNTKKRIGGTRLFYASRILIALVVVLVFHAEIRKEVMSLQAVQPSDYFFKSVGVILVALGIGFAIWARWHLGRNWGMPMEVKEKPNLITTGPYAYVRHPIYTGVLTAVLGSLVVSGPMWSLILLVIFFYFYFSAKKEEANMGKAFPTEYPSYKERTKMFIPFIF